MQKGDIWWNKLIKRDIIKKIDKYSKKLGGVLPHVSETDIFNTKGKVKFILLLIEEEIWVITWVTNKWKN